MVFYLRKQLSIAIIVYTGQLLVGFGLGWTAPLIPKLQDVEQTPLPDVITEVQGSWIGSVLYIGTIIGPYVSGWLSNVRGRKPCLFLGAALTSLAFLLLALANNLAMILAGRIFTGLGTGIIAVMNLVYIGEVASTNIRGILLTGTGIFSTLGTLLVYAVGPYAPYSVTSYVGLAITVIYMTGLFYVPETPAFYLLKGQEEQARETLLALGREYDIDKLIYSSKEAKLKDEIDNKGQWRKLFTERINQRSLFITLNLCILQQMSGIIVVVFFATQIFDMAGSSIEPNIATIIIGVTQLVASSITPVFVEITGRKVLLLASTAMCCLSLVVLGTYFFLYEMELAIINSLQWLPLVTLIVFFLSYDLGFGIIPGTFIGEMFHTDVRSIGSAFTSTTAWLFGFGVSTAFGYMVVYLGPYGTFWIYSLACALAFSFTIFCVPETKGKSLIEIQEMLSK